MIRFLKLLRTRAFQASIRGSVIALLILSLGGGNWVLRAADRTWSGGTDGTWNEAGNWDVLPTAGDTLIFFGTSNPATTNDFAAGTTFNGIQFVNDGTGGQDSSFTLSGNSIVLDGNISNVTSTGVWMTDIINLDIQLAGNTTIEANNGRSLRINGVISQDGTNRSVTYSGPSFVDLYGDNTYAGGTTIGFGIVSVFHDNALGTGTVTFGDNGINPSLRIMNNGMTIANDFVFTNGGNRRDIRFDPTGTGNTAEMTGDMAFDAAGDWHVQFHIGDGDTLELSGLLSGTGNPNLSGLGGDLILSNDANTFDNQLRVTKGNVHATSIANSGVASAAGTGSWLRLGFQGNTGGFVLDGNASSSTNRQVQIGTAQGANNTGGAFIANNSANAADTLIFTNANFNRQENNTGHDVQARTLTLGGTNTGNNEIQGVIRDNSDNTDSAGTAGTFDNTINLAKEGTGKWILSGTSTFTGNTTITEGTLVLGNATNTLPDTGDVFVNGGILDVGSNTDTVGNVTVAGGTIEGTTGVLTGASYDLQSGTVNGILGGTAGLTKTTSGTATLASNSTYTGATSVNAGTLNLTGDIASAVTVNNGGTLSGEGSAASFNTAAGGILSVDGTTAGAFSAAGVFDSSSGVSVLVSDAPTSGTFTVANYGSWTNSAGTGDFNIAAGGFQASARGATWNDTGSAITLNLGTAALTWTGTTDGIWGKADGKSNWTDGGVITEFYDADFITFDDTGIAQNMIALAAGNTFAPATMTFNNTAGAYTIDDVTAGTETITATGGAGITITGSGDVNLNAKITGNTTITHSGTGRLKLDGGNDLTNDFVGSIVVESGATLEDGGNDRTRHAFGDFSNTITIQDGATFEMSGDNDYEDYGTGSFKISGAGVGGSGALRNNGNQAQEAFHDELDFVDDVTIAGWGRIDVDGTIQTTGAANITVTKIGSNSFFVGGNNNSSSIAEWVINQGALAASNNDGPGNAHITINSGGRFTSVVGAGGTRTIDNNFTLNGGTIEAAWQDGSIANLTGNINVIADSRLDGANDTRFIRVAGALTGSSNLNIGNGEIQLLGDVSGFTGDFILAEEDAILTVANGKTIDQDIIVGTSGATKMLEAGDSSGASGTSTVNGTITINEETANGFRVRARATDTLVLNGAIGGTGTAGIDINGARTGGTAGTNPVTTGTVIFGANNDYTGTTTISGGTLQIGNGGADGSLGTGDVVNNAALVFNHTGTSNVAGSISGTGTVTHSGSGTTTLAGNNTYTGATAVNMGTLRIEGTNTSDITVAAGANLDGEGSTSGNLIFSGTTHTITADLSTAGALGSTGSGSTSWSNVADNMFIVNVAGGAMGAVDILTYGSGGFTGNLSAFAVGTGGSARGAVFADSGTAITLDAGIKALTWNGGTGTWDINTTANWTGGDTVFYNGDVVTFDEATSVGNVTLASDVSVGGMTVINTGTAFNFDNNSINLDGDMTLHNDTDVTINSVLSGSGGIVKQEQGGVNNTSNGTLFLSGNNTFTGGVRIEEGKVSVSHDNALGTGAVYLSDAGGDEPQLILGVDGLNISNDIISESPGSTRRIVFNVAGNGNAEISGDIYLNKNSSWQNRVQIGGGDTLTISGRISGVGGATRLNTNQSWGGTLILTNRGNDFLGPLHSTDGATIRVSEIADSGVASMAGAGSYLIVGSYIGNDGSIVYTGSGNTTNRQVQVGSVAGPATQGGQSGDGTIANDGTGALVFSNAQFSRQDSDVNGRVGARVLTLGGSNTDDNEIQGAILDNNSTAGAGGTPDNTVGLTKEGSGKWILSGTNLYTGNTTVTAGTLLINGDNSGAMGDYSVGANGTLGGTGTIGGAADISGTHTAGTTTGAGTQTFNNGLTYNDGSTITWNLINSGATQGTDWDLFDVTSGTLDFNNGLDGSRTFTIDDDSSFDYAAIAPNTTHDFLVWQSSTITGFDKNDYSIFYDGSNNLNGGSFMLEQTGGGVVLRFTAVPEPSTYALMGLALAGFGWAMRRRKRKEES